MEGGRKGSRSTNRTKGEVCRGVLIWRYTQGGMEGRRGKRCKWRERSLGKKCKGKGKISWMWRRVKKIESLGWRIVLVSTESEGFVGKQNQRKNSGEVDKKNETAEIPKQKEVGMHKEAMETRVKKKSRFTCRFPKQ